MKYILVAASAAAFAITAHAGEPVAQASGEWDAITWEPGGTPVAGDIVHIEGGFTVDYTGRSSPNFGRIYIGDNTGGLSSPDGTLNVSGGQITVNANAAGAFVISRSDNSVGTLNISGGTVRGVGNKTGAGMQIGFGMNSTGSVTISGGELRLASGVVVGFGDNSTGHFTLSDGTVSVGNNAEGGSFSVGGRNPESSVTATYEQTGGSMTVMNNAFRIGYSGGVTQAIHATAKITGGSFNGTIVVGRQKNVKGGGGTGGVLTIGHAASVSGQGLAWEVSGNGELIFALGPNDSFNPVDLTPSSDVAALVFSQAGARLTIDGTALKPSMSHKPITLVKFAADKAPTELSLSNVTVSFNGFDKSFKPELVWTGTSLQVKVNR